MQNISKLTRLTLHKALAPVLKDGAQRNLAVTSTATGIKVVGLYWGLKVVGLDPSPLLAIFGMFGAAVGFAGKDLVSNFISGATLAASNTFRKGDVISVGSSGKGKLIDMDMKYLYLEQEDGTLLMIPNSSVTTSTVSIVGGADRKIKESAYYDALEAAENEKSLADTPETRKAKQTLFTMFVLVPFLSFTTLVVFVACGFISPEDIKRWFPRTAGAKKRTAEEEEAEAAALAARNASISAKVGELAKWAQAFIPKGPMEGGTTTAVEGLKHATPGPAAEKLAATISHAVETAVEEVKKGK